MNAALRDLVAILCAALATLAFASEKRESFDRDPGWHGHNNRAENPRTRTVRHDFDPSATPAHRTRDGRAHAGYDGSPRVLPEGRPHDWSLAYEPGDAGGQIAVTLDDQRVVLELRANDRRESVRFNRFGIVSTWVDGNPQEVDLDDLRCADQRN
jgi:hypothetical protein